MIGTAKPKPARGEFLVEQRERRLERVATEQEVMRAALKRDHFRCRNPRCKFKKLDLPVDPCHAFRHRGMGGNPKGDRTATTDLIISLCRGCHGLLDTDKLSIEPQTPEWCDDLVAFYEVNKLGHYRHIVTETRLGVGK